MGRQAKGSISVRVNVECHSCEIEVFIGPRVVQMLFKIASRVERNLKDMGAAFSIVVSYFLI